MLGSIWLSRTVSTTFAFDKPLLTFTVLPLSAALAVLGLGYLLRQSSDLKTSQDEQHYEELPLNETRQDRDESPGKSADAPAAWIWRVKGAIVLYRLQRRHLLIGAIVLRVEFLRHIFANTQCAVLSWEPLIPIVFACWDYYSLRRRQHSLIHREFHDGNAYNAVEQRAARTSLRYVVTVSAVGFGSLFALATTRDPPSTFICASTLHNKWLVPLIQCLGTMLDVTIATCVTHYLDDDRYSYRGKDDGLRLISIGSAILVCSLVPLLARVYE